MQSTVTKSPRWWLWPTVLSLDAPMVVVLWQAMMARSAAVGDGATERFVLGCSVWLAYSADRWIEGWRLPPDKIQTHRHRFHQNWRWEIFAVWVAALGLDISSAVRGLTPAEFRAGALLLVPVAAYLLSHQFVHRRSRWRAPKEACVAVLLGAGSAAFAAAQPGARAAGLAVPLCLFVLLCFSNCALISVWENEVDLSHGQTSLALQFGSATALSRMLPWFVFIASCVAWLVAGTESKAAAACAAASGVLLGLVDITEARIGRVPARVLADVVLMTPAIPLLLGGVR